MASMGKMLAVKARELSSNPGTHIKVDHKGECLYHKHCVCEGVCV